MDARPPERRSADAAELARDLVERLSAIATSLSHGPGAPDGRSGAAASGPGAPVPLADFRSPRAVLENGAGYISPYLPPEASLRPLKALLLRVLRLVTRDQTTFNSALLEAIRGTLLAADAAFRETSAAIERSRTEAAESARREAGTAIARAEAAEESGREAERRILDALEKSRVSLEEALRAVQEEATKSIDAERRNLEEVASRLGLADEEQKAAQKEAIRRSEELRAELRSALERLRRVDTGTAASLAHFKSRADGIAADVLSTQVRVDALENERDRLEGETSATQDRVDALEEDREQLAGETLATQVRVDVLQKERERLAADSLATQVRVDTLERDRDRVAGDVDALEKERERLAGDSLATQLRVDGLERDRDLLLSQSSSTSVRVDSLETEGDRLEGVSASIEKAASGIAADLFRTQVRIDGLEQDRDRLSDGSAAGARTVEEVKGSLAALEARIAERAEDLRHLKLEWSTLRSEIVSLSGGPAKKGAARARSPAAPAADDPMRAGIYVDFEEGFRGSEEEIRRRQESDAALFSKAPGPVADLGCGRGEFLEALKAAGIPAIGCDANPVMAARAKKKGLKVERADLFEWLGGRRKGSLGGITAYQVVEHLPPARLYELVELSAAKLAPGGIVLFETVNPESAYAMKWFWMDLTHVRPVPAPSLARLLSASGFCDVRIDWRSPVPDSEAPPAELRSDEKLGPMMKLLFGPQDYAVIGRK